MSDPHSSRPDSVGAGAPEFASNETRLKQHNSVADQVVEMLDRFQQRLTLANTQLAERYIKSELHFLIHFRIRGIDEEFVAHFQRAEDISGFHKEIENWKGLTVGLFEMSSHKCAEVDTSKARTDSDKQAVLVDIVKLVNDPEIVSLPSLVWFDRVERVNRILPHALYFSRKSGFVFCGTALDQNACDGREADRCGADFRYIVDQLARLRIALGPDFIWIGIQEGAPCALEITDVLFGPFNFELDKCKSFIGSHGLASNRSVVSSSHGHKANG